MQRGVIYRDRRTWMLKWNAKETKDGKVRWVKRCKRLAPVCDDYRTEASVRPLADELLAPFNIGTARPQATNTVERFLEHVYLPHCKAELAASTYSGYKAIFNRVKAHLHGIRLREFAAYDANRLLKDSAQKNATTTTLRNTKAFLTGAFSYAVRTGVMVTNPMREAKSPKGTEGAETHATTFEELKAMLAVLPEPARTVVLVAALSGLSQSELRGLKWSDFTGDSLYVRRSVWGSQIKETKTAAREAPVPVIPLLASTLKAHRKLTEGDFIFTGATGKPLVLANLVRRDIRPSLDKAKIQWHGWHAFRRGLGSNLYHLGVPDLVVQELLRHSDVETTRKHYIKVSSEDAEKAMKTLARLANRKLK
jgi:integrase